MNVRVQWEGLSVEAFPYLIHRPGEFFTRLVGVDVSNVGNYVSAVPLYIPLVRWRRKAGQVFIEINSWRPLVYITLQRRPPYLSVFRFPWEKWDRDEP